jgi:TonB-linked SusC/RagA family outer membrane protein
MKLLLVEGTIFMCRTKKILIVSLLCFFSLTLSQTLKAQSVTGVVKDAATNELLANVTVREKGTNKTTQTDDKGAFKINVTNIKTSILVFSITGYANRELGVAGKSVLDITLSEITTSLNDVVVIGYGTAKKKDVLTSVSKANIDDMRKAPVNSFDQMLAGRVAGVNVVSSDGQPGGAATITIRGSTVSQEASPLYVIDGLPIENMDINSINPNDIESFEILKDPSSVAIYGSRGSNGVILITTKRGKVGPPRVTYSFDQNIQKTTKRIPMMEPYDFVKLQLELDSINSTPTNPSTRFRNIYLDPANGIDLNYYKTVPGYNWQDLVMQTGMAQNHNLNISGGNTDTRYSISGGYYDQKGLIINTGLRRVNGRFSLDQKLNSYLRGGISASYSNTVSFGTIAAGSSTGGVVQGMWQYRPVSGVGNQNLINNLIDSAALQDFYNGTSSATLGDNLISPLSQAQNEYRKNYNNTGYANVYLEASILKNLKLRVSGGYNSTTLKLDQFYNSQTQQGNLFKNAAGAVPNTNGINGAISTSVAQTYSTSNTLSYNTVIRKNHKLDALVGFEYQYANQSLWKYTAIQVPQATEYLGILALNTGTATNASQNQGGTRNQLYSTFGRVNYNYKGKYYLMGAMRIDGSSKFAPGNQWGYFPSGAAAWTFSEEPFFKSLSSIINYGKLRVTFGTTGNNKVGDFSYLSQFGALQTSAGYPYNNNYTIGIVPFFYGNNALTWETQTGTDIGLNLELLKGKISVEAVYYEKTSKNFLLSVVLPFTAGYSTGANSQYQNTGRVSNKGFEFTITTNNIKTKDFSWSTNFNISFNKNKILEFYNGLQAIQTGWNLTGTATAWIAKVGGPISQFYGYQWGGVYQYSDFIKNGNGTFTLRPGVPTYAASVQPGDPKYKDINGDGVVDANDQTTLGSPLAVHTGGFSNNFTYKNWSANIFFQWSYGNDILNANRIVFESTGGYALNYNQFASYANRWTPDNPTNDIPRARYNLKGDAGSSNPRPSSRVIEDGSFLRLKTISVAYNLPKSVLKKVKLNNVALTVSAQNIITWTKYSGMDPEVSTYRASNPANSPFGGSNVGSTSVGGAGYTFIQPSSGFPVLAGGYDYTPYPRALILNFGANITF